MEGRGDPLRARESAARIAARRGAACRPRPSERLQLALGRVRLGERLPHRGKPREERLRDDLARDEVRDLRRRPPDETEGAAPVPAEPASEPVAPRRRNEADRRHLRVRDRGRCAGGRRGRAPPSASACDVEAQRRPVAPAAGAVPRPRADLLRRAAGAVPGETTARRPRPGGAAGPSGCGSTRSRSPGRPPATSVTAPSRRPRPLPPGTTRSIVSSRDIGLTPRGGSAAPGRRPAGPRAAGGPSESGAASPSAGVETSPASSSTSRARRLPLRVAERLLELLHERLLHLAERLPRAPRARPRGRAPRPLRAPPGAPRRPRRRRPPRARPALGLAQRLGQLAQPRRSVEGRALSGAASRAVRPDEPPPLHLPEDLDRVGAVREARDLRDVAARALLLERAADGADHGVGRECPPRASR